MKRMQIFVVAGFVLTTTVLVNGFPIELNAFDGTEHLITFTPGWGYTADPIMYQTVTFTDRGYGGPEGLFTGEAWQGHFHNIPGASRDEYLNDNQSYTEIRMDFSTTVHRVGLLASTTPQTWFAIRAYDSDYRLLETVTGQMPERGKAVFLGLERPENIVRIELFEPSGSNGYVSLMDDLRFTSIPEPATLGLLALGSLVLSRKRLTSR